MVDLRSVHKAIKEIANEYTRNANELTAKIQQVFTADLTKVTVLGQRISEITENYRSLTKDTTEIATSSAKELWQTSFDAEQAKSAAPEVTPPGEIMGPSSGPSTGRG